VPKKKPLEFERKQNNRSSDKAKSKAKQRKAKAKAEARQHAGSGAGRERKTENRKQKNENRRTPQKKVILGSTADASTDNPTSFTGERPFGEREWQLVPHLPLEPQRHGDHQMSVQLQGQRGKWELSSHP